jgi:hypothetical protein
MSRLGTSCGPQRAAGILPKPSDERKRGEAFPTIKISEPNEAIPLDAVHRFANQGAGRPKKGGAIDLDQLRVMSGEAFPIH